MPIAPSVAGLRKIVLSPLAAGSWPGRLPSRKDSDCPAAVALMIANRNALHSGVLSQQFPPDPRGHQGVKHRHHNDALFSQPAAGPVDGLEEIVDVVQRLVEDYN